MTGIDWAPILLTLRLATTTLILLLLIGFPLAWWLARTKSKYKIIIEAITALPLILPPTVLGFYLLIAMGGNSTLGAFWLNMTGSTLTFSFSGLVIASIFYSLPFVVQPLQSGFEKLDRRAIDASTTLGASPFKTFGEIVLPQIKSALMTACILGFAHTVGEFGVVLMVGGNIPGQTQVLSIAIYQHVELLEYDQAHALSLGLLLFSFTILIAVYGFNRGRFREIGQ